MRRLKFVVPVLGMMIAPLIITACSSRETVVSTTSGGTQRLTAQALQQAVDAFADRLVVRIATVGDQVDAAIPASGIYRRTLIWRLRTAQVAFNAQHQSNALVSLMQLWYYTSASNVRAHSPDAQKLLGTHAALATTATEALTNQAEALASRALPPDAFTRVKADIEKSASSGELFSATSATDEAVFDQLLSASRLEKLIAIPLSPFDIFGGVNQGAEAITALSVTANRAVDLAEIYPQVIEWRLRLVALDIQELESVKSVVGNLDRLATTAQNLPVQLREQVGILLEQSGPVQQETQKTLAGVRDAGTALQGAMTSTQAAITSLNQFVATITPPPDPHAKPVDPAAAAPPFRIEDYTAALNALTVATKEIHATLTDLQQPAFSGRVAEATTTAVDHAQRAADLTIDRVTWRIAQLVAFAAACVLLLIIAVRWRRKT